MEEYLVVFIATEKEPHLSFIIIPFVLFLVGMGMLVYVIRGRRRVQLKGPALLIFPLLFTVFAAVMTLITTANFFTSKTQTSGILANNDFKVVEGVIENFKPMPYGGHNSESFTVRGVYFEFSDYSSYAGINSFNQTASHGGPIRNNGQKVRLTYVSLTNGDNLILKVETPYDQ